jgi:glycosyltransferase involved in cell wall biosynthesis
MKLQVVLIVKDEEYCLERCLNSVKGLPIVLCDTGSTDKTIEIANKFTDKIFHFKWCDDFAQARNFALSKCTADWVLFMDADWVLDSSIDEVIKTIDDIHDAFSVKLKASSGGFHYLPVLFKRGLTYSGKVHEAISPKNKGTSNLEITYYPNKNRQPDRNLNILLTMEKTPRTLFYIGKEYVDLGRYEEAIKTFDEYLKVSQWLEEKAEAYYYKALCLWRLSRGAEAREVNFEAIKINPDMKKALLLQSEMLYEPWKSKWKHIADNATNKDTIFI